ncbi:MAG TPA: PHB depolymerase family esterase [Flavitalea sp.]|nr:PHB depolymerase family esterase [Flavitalea sp.]
MKNLTAYGLAALLFALSSCQKDFVTDPSSVNGDVTTSNTAADDVLETALPVHTPRQIAINSNVSGYYETLPARYSLTTKRYPLIVFIHGVGELGTGLSRLNCCGLPYHIKGGTFPAKFLVNGVYYSFIVISPQFRVRPNPAQIQSVIDYAKNKYRVDATRVYVTGLSMGGGSTWDWSVVYGQIAAAIGPVCAGTKPTTSLAGSVATKNVAIWSLNSSSDAVVPIQWGKDWINWIDARNTSMASQTKLTIWDNLSHNGTWGKAFNPVTKVDGYNLYQWFLLHKRSGGTTSTTPLSTSPTTTTSGNLAPKANAGADQSIPKAWNYFPFLNATPSTDSDGWIVGFKWTKISGPSQYSFSSPNSGQTKANGLVAGTYVFRVTVTDNKGATSYDDVTINMTSTSGTTTSSSLTAPKAIAGPDQSIPVSWNYFPLLNATTSTDPDGWIASFKWSKISGPSSYSIVSPASGKTKVNGLVAGTYVFRVTVTDNSGQASTDDVTVTMTNN